MGWLFSGEWKTIKDILKGLHDDRLDPSIICLTDAVVTQEDSLHVRWQAVLYQGHSHVLCDLLEKSGNNWGYKDMSDDMGPMYFSCPLSILDAADKYPAKTETATQWRANCRAMHASRSDAYVESALEFATKKRVVENEPIQLELSNL